MSSFEIVALCIEAWCATSSILCLQIEAQSDGNNTVFESVMARWKVRAHLALWTVQLLMHHHAKCRSRMSMYAAVD